MTAELQAIIETVAANRAEGRPTFFGLSSPEIGQYNRHLMFGDDDQAFPGTSEWAAIVD